MINNLQKVCKREMIDLGICKINDECLLDVDFYQQKDWRLRLFIEFSTLGVDYFIQALKSLHIEEVETYIYSFEKISYFKTVKSNYKSIIDIFFNVQPNDKDWSSYDVVASAIIITNSNMDFIVFIDEYRESFYFYGNDIFIDKVLPASFEAYKDHYEGWYEIFEEEPCTVKYFRYVWDRYMAKELEREDAR